MKREKKNLLLKYNENETASTKYKIQNFQSVRADISRLYLINMSDAVNEKKLNVPKIKIIIIIMRMRSTWLTEAMFAEAFRKKREKCGNSKTIYCKHSE